MREILFRAKTKMQVRTYNCGKEDGKWVYGNYCDKIGLPIIRQFEFDRADYIEYEVDPDTVCEFTGLLDKNGKKIFEGDIIKYEVDREHYHKAEIIFKNCQFLCIDLSNKMVTQPAYMDYELEVIGNKFDLEVSDV